MALNLPKISHTAQSNVPDASSRLACNTAIRDLNLDRIAADSRVETYRASGPGGQKRNKTSSAVRIVHEPTALHAIAHESRSQHTNRAVALRRLQHRIALQIRNPINLQEFSAPQWWLDSVKNHRVRIGQKQAEYPEAIAMALDVLAASGWSVSEAAAVLGLTTGGMVALLREDHLLWAAVNRNRQAVGLRVLNDS